MTTNAKKLLNLFKSRPGKWFHSRELNEVAGWDWRKGISDLSKKYGYTIIKRPADSKFKYYALIPHTKSSILDELAKIPKFKEPHIETKQPRLGGLLE